MGILSFMHDTREDNKCSACSAIQVIGSVFKDALNALTDGTVSARIIINLIVGIQGKKVCFSLFHS